MRENAAMDSLDTPDGFLNVAIHVGHEKDEDCNGLLGNTSVDSVSFTFGISVSSTYLHSVCSTPITVMVLDSDTGVSSNYILSTFTTDNMLTIQPYLMNSPLVCPYGKMAVPLGGAELPLQKPQAYRSSQSG